MTSPPIVMVHGAFVGGWSFERFVEPFEKAGHKVLCPDLRGHAASEPRDAVRGFSMADYANDIAALCRRLDAPPLLIGHSMGGLVCQMAAARAPVAGLALLAPSAPWGVVGSTMEEAITAVGMNLLAPVWARAVPPNKGLMRRYSLSRLGKAEREAIVARLRPESGRAVWETLNWWLDPFMTTKIGPGAVRAPALVMVGEADAVNPPPTVRQTAAVLGAAYELLPQMSHWLVGEPGWRDAADLILDWLASEVRAAA